MMPSFTSVKPKIASSAATTMSQTAARPAPPPSAAPWMRPMTGFGQLSIARNMSLMRSASATFASNAQIERRAHPVDVGAAAEHLALAREHDGADVVGGGDSRERLVKLRDDLGVERVAHLGARERDAGDARRRRLGERFRPWRPGFAASSGRASHALYLLRR